MPVELILIEDVPKLGDAGDLVRVKPGFARNYLLPRGLALLATKGRLQELGHRKRVIEEKVKKEVRGYEELARRVEGTELEFQVQAGEEGKLFGSVTSSDVAEKLAEKEIELDRRKIVMEPIKALGEYEISVRLHREVSATIKLNVVAATE